jgi:hypothetical protein
MAVIFICPFKAFILAIIYLYGYNIKVPYSFK